MRPVIELHPDGVDLSPLASFIEHGAELPKETLVHRVAGKVEYSLLVYLKSLQFLRIMKDRSGKVFLL